MDRKSKLLISISIVGCTSVAAIYFLWKYYRQNCKQCQKITSISPKVVFLVSHVEDWPPACAALLEDLSSLKVLGIDCEWVSNDQAQHVGLPGRRPVSLLQLASASGVCVLVRLHLLPYIPDSLKQLLADRSILKVGVACMDDARYLLRDYNLECVGCVDLRHLVPRTMPSANVMQLGLQSLTKLFLGVKLDKSSSVRCSDWEAEVLTPQQVTYAACDAMAAVLIFVAMVRMKVMTSESGDYSVIAAKAKSLCQGIIDLKYSGKTSDNHSSSERTSGSPVSREARTSRAYVVRKKPLYHNCQLRSPDCQLLCTCDVRKAQWYIDKGLGEKVDDDPVTVRLLFEPSGRPVDEQNYYLNEKDNVCVVCGADESYIRKNIIPREYRKHFPPLLKEHKSHDVLLMCVACHQRSNLHDNELKRCLLAQCSSAAASSLDGHDKYIHDPALTKVKSAAKALLSSAAGRIPAARLDELQQTVRCFYGVEQLDSMLLQEAATIDTRLKREGFEEAGELVVRHVIEQTDGGLVGFERLWRQHFVDTMKPSFLPTGWSVEHSRDQLLCLEHDVLRYVAQERGPDRCN